MKKVIMFILKYLSATAAFFSVGTLLYVVLVLTKNEIQLPPDNIITAILTISALYGATSPITFSVKHFVNLSMITRLLIQTAVNYPILILSAFFFGWICSDYNFYKITTIYFFAGLAAAVFVCIYYPHKYRLYNDRLNAYKKKAMTEEI